MSNNRPSLDRKKLKIAYHEAGHAVMALILHQGIRSVSVREMDSPKGTDKYLGYTKLEPFEQTSTVTINELLRRVRISLGGYASEILFCGGSANIGGDDLASAVRWVENMMDSEEIKTIACQLPSPDPGLLDMIASPAVRAFIDYQIHVCVKDLEPFKQQIHLIADTLYKKKELAGDELIALFNLPHN